MDRDISEKIRELIDEIRGPLNEIQEIHHQQIEFIKSRIEYILTNKVSDKKEIEKILDELLELAYWDSEMVNESFYQLISYYKNIDNEATNCYEKYYIKIVE